MIYKTVSNNEGTHIFLDGAEIAIKSDRCTALEFIAGHAINRAEAAEARAVTFAETIETLVNEKAQAEQDRDGYKEAAHDWHMNYLDAIAKRDELRAAFIGQVKTIEDLRRQLEQAQKDLADYRAEIERLTRKVLTAGV